MIFGEAEKLTGKDKKIDNKDGEDYLNKMSLTQLQ